MKFKTNSKSILTMILMLTMIFTMTGCGSNSTSPEAAASESAPATATATPEPVEASVLPADGPSFNLILGHGAPEESDGHRGTLYFKKLIEERSGGKITVDSYPAFQLGTVGELIQNQKSGQIAMTVGTAGGSTSRALAFLDLPALYNDIETATAIVQEGTKARALIDEEYGKLNVKVLSIMPITYRQISSNKEIRSYEELQGLDIRTMENPLHMMFWEAVGANPTPLPFSELYIALQQGLVSAQENPLDTIYNSKIYEQQKYLVNSNHVMFFNAYTINIDTWNSMPEAYQTLITDTMKDVDKWTRETTDASQSNLQAKLQEAGLEVINFTDADFTKMKEAAAPVYAEARSLCGDDVIDEILATINK